MSTPHPQNKEHQRGHLTRVRYTPPPESEIRVLDLADLLGSSRRLVASGRSQKTLDFVEDRYRTKLWCVGDICLVQNTCVAIVGTRKVSQDGACRARRLARELAQTGVVIVSGLAEGVDTEALTAATEAGGRVIAVIGTPVDKAYPAANTYLQEKIYKEHLLISQFQPGRAVTPKNFPQRNKLMAAISDATAIVEASDTSGALHQAVECLKLNRWLFVARSLAENQTLHWPSKFLGKPNVKTLSATEEILEVVRIQPSAVE
jgi:DNA processing protein